MYENNLKDKLIDKPESYDRSSEHLKSNLPLNIEIPEKTNKKLVKSFSSNKINGEWINFSNSK